MYASVAALIAIRILALYLGIQMLVVLPQAASLMKIIDDGLELYVWLHLLQLGLAIVLWFLAPTLSRLMLNDKGGEVEIPKPLAESVVRVIFIVFGIYLIVTAIPSLASLSFRVMEAYSSTTAELSLIDKLLMEPTAISQLVFQGARVVLGAIMLIGNSGFARFVQWSKNFALDK